MINLFYKSTWSDGVETYPYYNNQIRSEHFRLMLIFYKNKIENQSGLSRVFKRKVEFIRTYIS